MIYLIKKSLTSDSSLEGWLGKDYKVRYIMRKRDKIETKKLI